MSAASWASSFTDSAFTQGVALKVNPTAFAAAFDDAVLRRGFAIKGAPVLFQFAPAEVDLRAPAPDATADVLAALRAGLPFPVIANSADEGMTLPYIVLSVSHAPEYGLSGEQLADLVTIRLDCWGTSALQAEAVADEVEAILRDNPELEVQSRDSGYDPATTADVAIVTVDRWL